MPDLKELLTEEAQRQRPDHVPPFDALLSRARRRCRYRRGAAVCSVLAAVIVVVAVVVTVFGGDGENAGHVAKPSPTRSPADAVALLPTDHWRPGDPGLQ